MPTVGLCHTVLKMALARTVRLQLVGQNVAAAKPPAAKERKPEAWTIEEVNAFLAATADHQHGPMWRLGLDAGLRLGELLALTWADVDLQRHTFIVRPTLSPDGKNGWRVKDGTKIGEVRAVAIGLATVAALEAHRKDQVERRLLLGPAWHTLDLVFDNGEGRYENHRAVEGSFDRAVTRAGVRRLTPRDAHDDGAPVGGGRAPPKHHRVADGALLAGDDPQALHVGVARHAARRRRPDRQDPGRRRGRIREIRVRSRAG